MNFIQINNLSPLQRTGGAQEPVASPYNNLGPVDFSGAWVFKGSLPSLRRHMLQVEIVFANEFL
jgi:hypothetical protein